MRDVLLQILGILDTINENISDVEPETPSDEESEVNPEPVVTSTRSRKKTTK